MEIPYTRTLENIYLPGQLEQALYPNLIDKGQTIQTIAVDSVLITNNWPPASDRYRRVAKFVEALFSRFAEFKKPPRHPKWQEVDLEQGIAGMAALSRRRRNCCSKPSSTNSRPEVRGGNVAAQSAADKQRLFQEFRDWSQGEGKK